MKKIGWALGLVLLLSTIAFAETAFWVHSSSPATFKYKVAWGSAPGQHTLSQEMNKADCVAGVDGLYGPYDCKLPLVGTFIIGNTYYYVGYSIAYDIDGNELQGPPTIERAYIARPGGTTTNTPPEPMQGLGIYNK